VSSVRSRRQDNRRLVVESASLGLGYAAFLIWVGSAFVGSFGDLDDAYPYWPAIPRLRTDTAGFIAFAVAIVCLVTSRYLQLGRRNGAPAEQAAGARPARVLAVQAVADVAAVLATGLVIYLSLNEAMHPWTLRMQLTHLLPWPTEGTVRVIALAVCLVSVATRRYLRATATRPRQTAAAEQAGVTAETSRVLLLRLDTAGRTGVHRVLDVGLAFRRDRRPVVRARRQHPVALPDAGEPVVVADGEYLRLDRLAQPGTDAVGLVDPHLHVAVLSSLVPCCPGARVPGPASPGRRR